MSVQNLSGINAMLAQMRAAVHAAAGHADDAQAVSHGGFADALKQSLKRVSHAQTAARAQAQAFELGAPEVSLNDVMIDMQKASIAFQTTVQVRNRLVAAYHEIAGMQV